jgi:hypothetical protein
MRWAVWEVSFVCMGREIQIRSWRSLKERDNLETLVVDNSKTLKVCVQEIE